MNFALNVMIVALKMMNFALKKMMNVVGAAAGGGAEAAGKSALLIHQAPAYSTYPLTISLLPSPDLSIAGMFYRYAHNLLTAVQLVNYEKR